MGQFHFTPERYLELMHEEVPLYDELQERTAEATNGVAARRILELGMGTGETTRRILTLHPGATVLGVDSSAEMLAVAERDLGAAVETHVASFEDELPAGPFDLVVSALAVHHLGPPGKRDLFGRVAVALRAGGRFVLADVVVPASPDEAVTPLTPGFDLPDTADEQLDWLRAVGFDASLCWAQQDLAILLADLL